MDQLGNLRANQMCTEKLASRLVENGLDYALVIAEGYGLAIADKWKTTDANVMPSLFRSLFSEADRCNLREAVSASGDHALVDRMRVKALDRLDTDDAFVLGLV